MSDKFFCFFVLGVDGVGGVGALVVLFNDRFCVFGVVFFFLFLRCYVFYFLNVCYEGAVREFSRR